MSAVLLVDAVWDSFDGEHDGMGESLHAHAAAGKGLIAHVVGPYSLAVVVGRSAPDPGKPLLDRHVEALRAHDADGAQGLGRVGVRVLGEELRQVLALARGGVLPAHAKASNLFARATPFSSRACGYCG